MRIQDNDSVIVDTESHEILSMETVCELLNIESEEMDNLTNYRNVLDPPETELNTNKFENGERQDV